MLSSETSDSFLCSCLCVEELIKNTIIKTYCLRICCQGTPKRAVHAEGGAVSINTKAKSEDTETTGSRNRRHCLQEETDYESFPEKQFSLVLSVGL